MLKNSLSCLKQFELNLLASKLFLIANVISKMDLESIMPSETSQAVKEKYHVISPISGPNQQNKQASKIQSETLK